MAVIHRVCTVPEHEKTPGLDCRDCEERFCRECGEELTHKNSQLGHDTCDGCLDKIEEQERADGDD